MRRVLVDLLFFTGTKGGMESYVREVYSRFSVDDPEFEYVGYASTELAATDVSWFPGRVIDSGISGEDRVAWARGELLAVARAARRERADLVHCPANFGPWRSRVPVVLTVHDLLAFRHPEFVPGAHARALRWMVRTAARSAAALLTVSGASRDDLVACLGVPSRRITVTPLAGSRPLDTTAPRARRDDLLLAVGNRMPHKGFETLLEALARIPVPDRPRLTITGSHGDDPLAPVVERLGLARFVDLRGWLSRDELEALYGEATALVFPTRFEGFGLPPLEAMSRGCPVIVSDLPVMHEVAGEAALYVDPTDADAIARGIRALLEAPDEREQMSRAGLARAARFSWEATAEATRAALVRVFEDVEASGR
ncbi:glycosyltransferase involved in cell wall biosynthesis [Agromyces sp. 3263]|uniref:glycosyltransferase family 4 protein n=1 Tax=Agromyces sp. 3263 TaxID=2817750 RepID=UPI002854FDE0|nr:glycosyltransferase family 1 protein [Agromyces sp. 3263]MDR6904633.1 glycosyltransferase involved in cell wall biosynthesis [Agromyces sp. 3263]